MAAFRVYACADGRHESDADAGLHPMSVRILRIEPLTRAAFAPFGDVIEPEAAQRVYAINQGTTQRFHDIALIDTQTDGGRPIVSLCRAQPRQIPFVINMLECHPLGSQAFIPLGDQAFLVIVALHPESPPRAFLASSGQGVNYRRGAWHHPLIALHGVSDFLIIDRGGGGNNCDEVLLPHEYEIERLSG